MRIRTRRRARWIAILLSALATLPFSGCTSTRGGPTPFNLLLGVGAAVGGYFLTRELTD
jgi:hypothetical protein